MSRRHAYRCKAEKIKYDPQLIILSTPKLDEPNRDIVLMRLAERRTWERIGDALHCSPTTARRYFRQAVKALEKFLDWDAAMKSISKPRKNS